MEKGKPLAHLQFSNTQVTFTGRLLRWAWLRGSSPSSLTSSTRVGSRRLGRGSPWLNARTGRGKRSLLGFVAWVQTTPGRELVLTACLERVSEREAGESFWRERAVRDCITLYNCIRLTPMFSTVLNYSTTGSRCVVVWEFCGMQGLVVLWYLHFLFVGHYLYLLYVFLLMVSLNII